MQALDEAAGAKNDLLDDVGHGQIDANDAGADFAGEFRQGCGVAHAEIHGIFGWSGAAIPHDDLRAVFMQVACVGPAHVAEADESDCVTAERFAHEQAWLACIWHASVKKIIA
jgi:hypothetical protein